jgi:hypothetical protein
MKLRELDRKYFGGQGEPGDVIAGNSADSCLNGLVCRKPGWRSTEILAAEV